MITLKMIGAAIGSAIGLAALIALGIFAYQIKGELRESRTQKAIADSVHWQAQIDELRGNLLVRDREAATTRTVFVQAREQQRAKPIVTGGGKVADSIANAAIAACYEKATAALTACEVARKTADSLPAMKDSLTNARLRLAGLRSPPRWTAKGFVGYAWPMRKPMIAASSDFKIPFFPLNATAGGDYLIMGAPRTSLDSAIARQKWRTYLGASIPFR